MHSPDTSSAAESCNCSRIHSDEFWGTDIRTCYISCDLSIVFKVDFIKIQPQLPSIKLFRIHWICPKTVTFTLRWECEVSCS